MSCAHIYSALDQTARKINLAKFSLGKCSALIVTDLAARGLDIPLLDNVINYSFPAKGKLFLHRVGKEPAAALSLGGSRGYRARLLLLEVERPRPRDPTDQPGPGGMRCRPDASGLSRLLSLLSWHWATWPLSPRLPEVLSVTVLQLPVPGACAALRPPPAPHTASPDRSGSS